MNKQGGTANMNIYRPCSTYVEQGFFIFCLAGNCVSFYTKGATMSKEEKAPKSNLEKKKRNYHLGVHHFFKSKSGTRFLLVMEAFLAAAFFAQPHLYYNPEISDFFMRFYADSLTICGVLFAILVFLTVKKFHFSEQVNRRLTTGLGILMPLFAFLWLEFYNNAQFWVPVFQIPIAYLLLDFILYVVIYMLLLLLFNNVRNASIVMTILTALFGFLNYELTVFRSMSFIASDIYSFMTAMSVANTYQIQIDVDSAEYIMLAIVMVAAMLKLEKIPLFHRKRSRFLYLLGCIASVALVVEVYVYSSFLGSIGVDFRVYRPQYKYRYYGTLLTTARTFGYLHVAEPKGYSEEAVKKIIADFREEQGKEVEQAGSEEGEKKEVKGPRKTPNIIVIMNESFADLKAVGDLPVTQDYMPYFRGLDNTIKGYTYASIFGGNTANSEFEFLTGNTLAFLPDNSVPYQLFLRDQVPGLTHALKDQGFGPCFALHPYYKTGYSRYKVYPLMGFDQFYTSDDFSIFTDTVNYHITDYEDYKKITDLYERKKEKDVPFYMFNVTMQNHGSYDGSLYETGDDILLEGSYQWYDRTEQYLNMIKMSDDALKYLVEYFDKVKDPTVILFFGDHQPDLDESFYNALVGGDISELEGEELEKLYKVPFLIWANYDIKERNVDKTSMNYLSTYLAEVSGIEKTDYLDYLTQLRKKIPCINALGYWGDDGQYYDLNDQTSPYYETLQEYRFLEYNNIFGKEEQVSDFFYLKKQQDNK